MDLQKQIGDAIFYPASPDELTELVNNSLSMHASQGNTGDTIDNNLSTTATSLPAALLVPHASYDQVSFLMGAAYSQIQHLKPENIYILAPLHGDILHEDTASGLSIFYPECTAFTLFDSQVPVDHNELRRITSGSRDTAARHSYFDEEPSIELQLPYILQLFPNTPVTPLLAGRPSAATVRALSAILGKTDPARSLYIITSHLTGYIPLEEAKQESAVVLDNLCPGYGNTDTKGTSKANEPKLPGPGLMELLHRKAVSMCGAHLVEGMRKSRIFSGTWDILGTHHFTPLQGAEKNYRTTVSAAAILRN